MALSLCLIKLGSPKCFMDWLHSYLVVTGCFFVSLSGPAQGLGNLGLRPHHKKYLPFTKKVPSHYKIRVHPIVKDPKFYKKYEFFQIVFTLIIISDIGISQILLETYKLTCYLSKKSILSIY